MCRHNLLEEADIDIYWFKFYCARIAEAYGMTEASLLRVT
jgi:hypothetical protein